MRPLRCLVIFFILAALLPAANAAQPRETPPAAIGYTGMQMDLRQVAHRIAVNAERLTTIQKGLAKLAIRPAEAKARSVETLPETLHHLQAVIHALAELIVRFDHQAELLDLGALIEPGAKEGFFLRRMDHLYVVREFTAVTVEAMLQRATHIQNNAALHLMARAKHIITAAVSEMDRGAEIIAKQMPTLAQR